MAVNFGQIGEIYKLQKEARAMQKKMKKVLIKGESRDGDVVVQINGLQEVEAIDIDDELLSPETKELLIKRLRQAFKDANKKFKKEMAKDMDVDKLKGMLGM